MARKVVWRPQPVQEQFLRRGEYEALYGGAAGGGKSEALVMEALRQVHIPHYRALILRNTYPKLSELIGKSLGYYPRAFPGVNTTAAPTDGRSPAGRRWNLDQCTGRPTASSTRAARGITSPSTS